MLQALFGNETVEKILLYLTRYTESYASEIAQAFSFNLRRVQLQLDRLEKGGIIVSSLVGRTRVYRFNPRWYFQRELAAILDKALESLSAEERDRYFMKRTRPRRKGKELWPSPAKPRSRS